MAAGMDPSPSPRYRMLGRIGRGGMGEVFRAYDRLTAEVIALKQVRLPTPLPPLPGPSDETGLPAEPLLETALAASASSKSSDGVADRRGRTAKPVHADGERGSIASGDTLAAVGSPSADRPGPAPISSNHDPMQQELRLHLTQEFHTLAGLRHPHIVGVLDYGFDRDRQPYFTMELLKDAISIDQATRGKPFAEQVGLLLQMLQALTYLHRRGILHREIWKPNFV